MTYIAIALLLIQPSLGRVHLMNDGDTVSLPGIEPQVFCQNYPGLSWIYRTYHSAQVKL